MFPVAPEEVIPAVEPIPSVAPEVSVKAPAPETILVPQLSVPPLLTANVLPDATEILAPRVTDLLLLIVTF